MKRYLGIGFGMILLVCMVGCGKTIGEEHHLTSQANVVAVTTESVQANVSQESTSEDDINLLGSLK